VELLKHYWEHAFKYNSRYVRFEVFTAVTKKNAVAWDVKFVPERRHITSPLQSPSC
jgi:hypothetical protein